MTEALKRPKSRGGGYYDTLLDKALDIAVAALHKRWISRGQWWPADVEEAEQDIRERVIKNFHSYDPERGALSTWTYQVVTSWIANDRPGTFTGQLRRRMDHELACSPIHEDESETPNPLLDQLGGASMAAPTPAPFSDLAEDIIAKFPERLQGSVRLVWGDGLNSTQAGGHLGINEITVRRNLMRARAFIAEHPDEFALVA